MMQRFAAGMPEGRPWTKKKDDLMEKTPDGGILSKEETERAAERSGE